MELVRTTIEVVESQIDELMPKGDRPILHVAIDQYSREVAFSAAEIYARAAELRGAWDERLEALVVDAVLRGRPTRPCCHERRLWAGIRQLALWLLSDPPHSSSRRRPWNPSGIAQRSQEATCWVRYRATG